MSELARALRVPVDEVVAWESGERFPTKRSVERMRGLLTGHRTPDGESSASSGSPEAGAAIWAALADPKLWTLIRKLAASPELRDRVLQLAAAYPDPARRRD